MTLSGDLRRCSLNTVCLLRVLSILPLVCALRTERQAVNLPPVPATNGSHTVLASSARMPFISRFGHGSFVALGQSEAEIETPLPAHSDIVKARHASKAASHGVPSPEHGEEHEEQSFSAGTQNRSAPMYASWIEVPNEAHKEESSTHRDTVLGRGRNPQDLTDEELHSMTPGEGLTALLSQGKDLVADVKGTLDGFDAVLSLREVTQKLRDEIQKDVQALNRTISEEFANIDELRKLQEAQTAVLRSQLSFLMPKHTDLRDEVLESTGLKALASGAALHGFGYVPFITAFTVGISVSVVLI
uniref:Transmembrane protein n=1 Tax=Sarcocystis aucheniae TaxID=65407 RepID=A0A5P9S3L0_9APIC|nr:hypothetical protein [Sarcocystis aucheniae]